MRIRATIISSVILVSLSTTADADVHCEQYVCVDVSTDSSTGQITIHATKKKPGSTAAPKPKPANSKPAKPKPKRTYRPKPVASTTPKAKTPTSPKRTPRVTKKKAAPAATSEEAISLSDQLTQLIPSSAIGVTPFNGAVTELPTYFSTTAPPLFATESNLLGITVGISLKPIYHWEFGDGQSADVTTPNAVVHIYKQVGRYSPSLTISWSGTWNTNGFTYQVLGGAIIQRYSITLDVHQGPTQYRK